MNPGWDFHAIAPEIIISATIIIVLIADFFFQYRRRFQTSQLATIGVLAAMVPVVTLAVDGGTRRMFGGAFVVDPYSIALTGFFLAAAYVTLLLSVDYIGDGDYYQGEYYVLLLTSVLGMMVMSSARDLITIFVALETISIPTFVLAGLAQARPEVERGGDQVLPDRRALLRGDALRHVAGVRPHRLDAAARHRARRAADAAHVAADRRGVPDPGRVRVQDQRGPVPLLGAGHLRGRAHPGHRVPLGLVEGRRLRRDALDHLLRAVRGARHLATGALGARGRVDDPREPRRAAPDEHRPDAGVLVDRAGRVHPRAVRGRRRRRARRSRRSRRSSSTCSSTAR